MSVLTHIFIYFIYGGSFVLKYFSLFNLVLYYNTCLDNVRVTRYVCTPMNPFAYTTTGCSQWGSSPGTRPYSQHRDIHLSCNSTNGGPRRIGDGVHLSCCNCVWQINPDLSLYSLYLLYTVLLTCKQCSICYNKLLILAQLIKCAITDHSVRCDCCRCCCCCCCCYCYCCWCCGQVTCKLSAWISRVDRFLHCNTSYRCNLTATDQRWYYLWMLNWWISAMSWTLLPIIIVYMLINLFL